MGGGGGREVQEGGGICVHIAESLLCAEETNTTLYNYIIIKQLCVSVCVCAVMSNSLQPHGLRGPPGSSVHGILQARTVEWVAISYSRGSS